MSRFNGLPAWEAPRGRFRMDWPVIAGLKPGANEILLLFYEK